MNSNWSYSPETKSWVMTSVTLTFDLWPWTFAWTLRRSLVITPENFMMIRWWEHSQKGVTDRRTDGQTDRRTDRQTENTICRAAWSQLKMKANGFKMKKKKKTRTQSDCLREVISMWLIIKAYYGSGIFTTIPISYKCHEYRIWRK